MVWIDVTEVKNWHGHHTGIQRVISKIGEQLITDPDEFGTCYFDYSTNVFRKCNYNFAEEIKYLNQTVSQSAKIKKVVHDVAERLKARAPESVKKQLKEVRRLLTIRNVKDEPILFQEGDILLIPGAFWIYPIEHIKELKQRTNIGIFGIMYDLVPLVVPQFTAKVTIDGFGKRFEGALEVFDGWFAISKNTKKDMLEEARKKNITLEESSIVVIKLGGDAVYPGNEAAKPISSGLRPDEFSLFVSTIEARKNQFLVYQAVKRLQEKSTKHLPVVLVGKRGWLSNDFIYILQNDTSLEGKIIWLEKIDDRGLRWLYRNCAFTIYPSFYEGWGLPVAESLAYGKPCIAANTASIPEIAGDLIEYFSPHSADQLATLMDKMSNDNKHFKEAVAKAKNYNSTTWQETAGVVKETLLS